MSTVGKVLCILIVIPALVWIWLAAGVSEMNHAWGKRVEELAKSIDTTSEEIRGVQEDIRGLKSKIQLAFDQRDQRLTTLRSELAQLYRYESLTKESQERYNYQVQSVNAAAEAATRRQDKSDQDLAQTKTSLENARAALAKVKDENARDREKLQQLRDQFQQLLADSRERVENVLRAEQAESPPSGAPTISR